MCFDRDSVSNFSGNYSLRKLKTIRTVSGQKDYIFLPQVCSNLGCCGNHCYENFGPLKASSEGTIFRDCPGISSCMSILFKMSTCQNTTKTSKLNINSFRA